MTLPTGVRQRISSSPRHNKNLQQSVDSRDDNEFAFSANNSNSSSSCAADRQRSSPRSFSTVGSGDAADKLLRHSFKWSLSHFLFASLLLATVWCGVVNTAALMVLPVDGSVVTTTTSSSFPLFCFLKRQQKRQASPRVVHLDPGPSPAANGVRIPAAADDYSTLTRKIVTDNSTMAHISLLVATEKRPTDKGDECVPMAEWQTQSFATCNTVHEIDLPASTQEQTRDDTETTLKPLGEGWFRTTWKLESLQDTSVLKTLRVVRAFVPEFFELHRRDATAMERLTSSNYVMDVYAYCGQSAVNEIADFPFAGVTSLESFNRRMRGRDSARANAIKLRMAASIATGVADIHAVESMDGRPAMVHYDLNPRNVALCAGGRPKLNDFNIAEFLRYNPETNETCGFPSRMHEPWWRAPEEMNMTDGTVKLDHTVDVYSLGNILYHILTTHSPRGKMKRERMETVRPVVAQGIAPEIPEPFASQTDPFHVAFRQAMALCFAKEPKGRGTAEEVADLLTRALIEITAEEEASKDAAESAHEESVTKADASADDDQGTNVEERE